MPVALSISLPLVLAAVFIASAAAKLRTPESVAGWKELGVPTFLRREWLRRLHPWGELILGCGIAVVGGWAGLALSLIAVAVMAAYTVLIVTALRRSDEAACACFGARRRVTRLTVVRNVWLTLVAIATAGVIWSNPLVGGALASSATQPAWLLALAIAAVTTALILWPDDSDAGMAPPSASADDELDYIRTRTPAVPVTQADGTIVNLRTLAARKPLLLLAVSSICGACEGVVAMREPWRRLLPEVDVRLLLAERADRSLWTERTEPQSLHDPENLVASSIEDWATPTALLLGADGMTAGGPVTGDRAIASLVADIYETLHGSRPKPEELLR